MTIDKAKLKELLAEIEMLKAQRLMQLRINESLRARRKLWVSNCEKAEDQLLDVQHERDQLKAENEALRKDLESHKRMLLAAACDVGAIGEALGADMDDDASAIEGLAAELRKDAEWYRFVRNPIGTTSPLAIWNEGKMPLFSGMADAVVDEFTAKEAAHD